MQHTVQHTSVAACLNIVERNERFPRFDETISSKINNNRDPSIGYIGYTRNTRRDTIGEKLQSISRVCESHDVVQVRHTRMIIIMLHRGVSVRVAGSTESARRQPPSPNNFIDACTRRVRDPLASLFSGGINYFAKYRWPKWNIVYRLPPYPIKRSKSAMIAPPTTQRSKGVNGSPLTGLNAN